RGRMDVARERTEFRQHGEIAAGGKLLFPHLKSFYNQRAGTGQGRAQLLWRGDDAHLGRKQIADAFAHARNVAVEVRLLMGEEVGEGGVALGRGARIEQDADHAQEGIVLDNQNIACRHHQLRWIANAAIRRGGAAHSSLKLVAFMIGVQRASSSRISRSAASGPDAAVGSKPQIASAFWNSASAITLRVSAAKRSTIGRGTPAGANRPMQFAATLPRS